MSSVPYAEVVFSQDPGKPGEVHSKLHEQPEKLLQCPYHSRNSKDIELQMDAAPCPIHLGLNDDEKIEILKMADYKGFSAPDPTSMLKVMLTALCSLLGVFVLFMIFLLGGYKAYNR